MGDSETQEKSNTMLYIGIGLLLSCIAVGVGIYLYRRNKDKKGDIKNNQYFVFYDSSNCSTFPTGGYKFMPGSCESIEVANSSGGFTVNYIKTGTSDTKDSPDFTLYSDSSCTTATTSTSAAGDLETLVKNEGVCESVTTANFATAATDNGIYYDVDDWGKENMAMFQMYSDSACTTAINNGSYFVANLSSAVPTTSNLTSATCAGTNTVLGVTANGAGYYRDPTSKLVQSYFFTGSTDCSASLASPVATPSSGCLVLGTVSSTPIYGKEV
jgi:hypothetical protein